MFTVITSVDLYIPVENHMPIWQMNNNMLPYFLHMYQCLQNHNEMFTGNDNDI